jgi:hypothetical protein
MALVRNRSRRDAGLTALYLGVFAAIWFSVPNAGQPLRGLLIAGAVASLLALVFGAIIGFGSARENVLALNPAAGRRYAIIVAAAFAAAGLGSYVLVATGQSEFITVWIAGVVGLHFFPLAPVLRDRPLYVLGVLMCGVALAGLITGLASGVAASTVVGTGAGVLLLGYAVLSLVEGIRRK